MAITPVSYGSNASYKSARLSFLASVEGFEGTVYADPVARGIPTIGYGVALVVNIGSSAVPSWAVRSNVVQAFNAAGISLTTYDQTILAGLRDVVEANDVSLAQLIIAGGFSVAAVFRNGQDIPTITGSGGNVSLLAQDGNGQWAIRTDIASVLSTANLSLTGDDFVRLARIAVELNSSQPRPDVVDALFNGKFSFAPLTYGSPTSQGEAMFDFIVSEAETRVTNSLSGATNTLIADSLERLALVDLAYNAPGAIFKGSNLAGYLDAGNRVAAWFEIRYRSNRQDVQGNANRRREDSNLFGLFDSHSYGVYTDGEAKEALGYVYARIGELQVHQYLLDQAFGSSGDLVAAKNYIQNTYAQGNGIDSVVTLQQGQGFLIDHAGRDVLFVRDNESGLAFLSQGGADYAYGGNLADTFMSIDGHDYIRGGGGNDTISVAGELNHVFGDAGDDHLYIDSDYSDADGGADNDYFRIEGAHGDFQGGSGDDYLYVLAPYNTLHGGADNDFFLLNADGLQAYGDGGNDTFSSWGAGANIDGGAGEDTILAYGTGGTYIGGANNDTLWSSDTSGTLEGGSGSDTYWADGGTIADSDGNGTVFFSGVQLQGGVDSNNSGIYVAGNITYRMVGSNLLVQTSNRSLIINDFSNGELGINLQQSSGPAGPAVVANAPPEDPFFGLPAGSWGGGSSGSGSGGSGSGPEQPGPDPGSVAGPGDLGDAFDRLDDIPMPGDGQPNDLPFPVGPIIDDVKHKVEQANHAAYPWPSPIVLDLDGDGIEVSALAQSIVRFDLDANQFAETTGWVGADDGILVLDRNANGVVDGGAEVFGDHTPLDAGGTATNGYEALSDLDANADGIIDANDAGFGSLRVWRDLNQNGKSEDTELFGLPELEIESISADYSAVTQTINGNSVQQVSSFTYIDGTSYGTADVYFQTDPTNSRYVGPINFSFEALLLPTARGYGNVKDLYLAVSEDPELYSLVEGVAKLRLAETSQDFTGFAEAIAYRWAGVDGVDPDSRGGLVDARKIEALEAFLGLPYEGSSGPNPTGGDQVPYLNAAWDELVGSIFSTLFVQGTGAEIFSGLRYSFANDTILVEQGTDLASLVSDAEAAQPTGLSDLAAYWKNVRSFLQLLSPQLGSTPTQIDSALTAAIAGSPVAFLGDYWDITHIGGTDAADTLTGRDGYQGVLTGGAGDDTLIAGAGGGYHLFGGRGDDTLESVASNAGADTYYFGLGDGRDTIQDYASGGDAIVLAAGITTSDVNVTRDGLDLIVNVGGDGDQMRIENWYSLSNTGLYLNRIESLQFADSTVWDMNTLQNMGLSVHGTAGDDTINGLYSFNDTLYGEGGNDTLDGSGGDDTVYGGAGDDTLYSSVGADVLDGGTGNDTIELTGNASGQTIHGGTGNDTISSNDGDQIYNFDLGDGQDTISDFGGGNDRIVLGAGISTSDVGVSRDGDDLLINVGASGDQMRIHNWYTQNWSGSQFYRIESLEFADSTVWNASTLQSMGLSIHGTSGDDTLNGLYSYNDTLYGEGGNDTLDGSGGDDTLYGGAGDDTLSSSYGADVLDGGAGNDTILLPGSAYGQTIRGGTGNDTITSNAGDQTYYFDLGDGQDTISDYGSGNDRIVLGAGIATSDVGATRDGVDLLINVGTGGDQMRIQNWYSQNWAGIQWYRVESLEFADSTVWNASTLQNMGLSVHGTSGNDTVNGLYSFNDTLYGEGGNDTLDGSGGDDTLYGGAGDDTLYSSVGADVLDGGSGNDTIALTGNASGQAIHGGTGNDTISSNDGDQTYDFDLGDGQDTISDYGGGNDILHLDGFDHEDLWFSQQGNNLVIDHVGSDDRITVTNWYTSAWWKLEKVEVDGVYATAGGIQQLVTAMASFSVPDGEGENISQETRDDLAPTLASVWQTAA